MIPQAFIQELLDRVDIVEVVGRAVKLRKAGANMVGLCPFHAEKSPSFTVSPAKQFYHCFGCQAHGSAIGFLMEHSGLSFVDAVNDLAQGLGLTVPDERSQVARVAPRPNLVERLEQAARFYQQRLRDSAVAVEYLKGRGLSGQTAARFGLGYAPPGWRSLEAVAADYDDPVWEEVGLVKRPDDQADAGRSQQRVSAGESVGSASDESAGAGPSTQRKRYDRFRDRIMFPIRNPRGAVIGFGGRVLHKGEPKYLNSPETALFQKGRELYGLFEARKSLRELNTAIVVEGYMDVVMLAEHGVNNAVATLGTATTADHIRKLLRLVDRLVFSFDGDAAGRKAAWRALSACLPVVGDAQQVTFLFLPDGADPDSFVREHGADEWAQAVARATPLSRFLFDGLADGLDMASPEGRAAFLAGARPMLHALTADGLRLQLLHEAAELARIRMGELERFMAAAPPAPTTESTLARTAGSTSGTRPGRSGSLDHRSPDAPGGGRRAVSAAEAAGRWGDGAAGDESIRRQGPSRRASLPPRNDRPDLERALRLLAVCHPGLCSGVRGAIDPMSCPPAIVAWFDALADLPAGTAPVAALAALRAAGMIDVVDVERDLATDWRGVTLLSLDEARHEFEGALAQLEQRATRQAARDMAAHGLTTDDEREVYRALLASKR